MELAVFEPTPSVTIACSRPVDFLLNERIGIKYETEPPLNKRIMAFDQNDQIGRFFNVF